MKILLAVDGSKHALAAASKCCEFISTKEHSQIKIVSVADISKSVGIEPFGVSNQFHLTINNELKKAAEEFVSEAKKVIEEKVGENTTIETEVIQGSPKAAIVEEAESWGADLIVVGSHGYGFFERMLMGSVSDAILHHAPCSVLVVKIEEVTKEDSGE
jgi:nucleotide-binding universal stress UspA family protein